MTGRLIRILVCTALGLLAAQASAQSSAFGVEYRWMTTLGVMDESVQYLSPERSYKSATFMRLMIKPFVKFDSADELWKDDNAGSYSRYPDPEFGLPQAFRRPQQMRLRFRIRF